MKVILRADVKGLGRKNDVKEVKEGYFRNVLRVHRIAEPATAAALARREKDLALHEHALHVRRMWLETKLKELEAHPLSFPLNVDGKGNVFGSVNAHDITKALEARGIADAKPVMEKPIRTIGSHAVFCNFGSGLKASISIRVAAKT